MTGKKIESIKNDNRVCFAVEEIGPQVLWDNKCGITQIYKSVICYGTAELIADFDTKKVILTKMVEKFVPQKYNYSSMKDQYIYATTIIK